MSEKTLAFATLVYPVRGDGVSLGLKTSGIGQWCLNGFGGGKKAWSRYAIAPAENFSRRTAK